MNKKLQNGLVMAVSAAMGTGIVAPIIAAAATTGTNLDAQYAEAYNATVKATASKDQKDLTAARVLVDGLYQAVKGTKNEYLATTLSSLLDPAQQVKLVALDGAIKTATASVKQADINAARALILDMPTQWKNAFSSAIDTIQQALMTKVNDAVVKAETSKLDADKTAAQALVAEVKTVTNNADVLAWANAMGTRADAVVTAVKVSSVSAISTKSLKVTFNSPMADTSKVTFAVTRDTAPVAISTVTWNDAKTEATLSVSYQLFTGSYVVTPTVDGKALDASTPVAVTQSQVAKIVFNSNNAVLNATSDAFTTGIKVLNQYGEDITNNYNESSLNIVDSRGTATLTNGVITSSLTSPATYAANENVVLTVVDPSTGVSATQTLVASSALGVATIAFGDVTTDDANTAKVPSLDSLGGSYQYWIPLTIKDQAGNTITDLATLQNNVTLLTSNVNIVNTLTSANIVKINGTPAIKLNAGAATATSGNVTITAVSKSGVASSKTITVADSSKVDSFVLGQPSDIVKKGVAIALPFTAVDQNGKNLTAATGILAPGVGGTSINLGGGSNSKGVTISVTNGTIASSVDANNNLILKVTPTGTSGSKVVLNVVTATGKSQNLSLSINDAPVAKSITGPNSDYFVALQEGQVESLDLVDANIDYKDQYGNDVELGNDLTGSANTLTVAAVDASNNIVTWDNTAKTFTASSTKSGSAQFTLTLKDSKGTTLDTYTLTLKSVALADITQFSIEDFGKFYTGTTYLNSNVKTDYTKTITVDGLTADGTAVQIDPTIVKSATISAPFAVTIANSGLATQAITIDNATDKATNAVSTSGADKTATITLTVEGANAPIAVAKTFTYNDAAPVIQSIAIKNVSDDSTFTSTYAKDTAANVVTGNKLANIYFQGKDQYGTKAKALDYTVTNLKDANGNAIPSATTSISMASDGTITVTGTPLTQNSSFVVTASHDGVSTSIKVVLN